MTVCAGHERMRATQRPNSRTRPHGRSASSAAVRGAGSPHGPRSKPELERLGRIKRSPCDGLAPPTPTSGHATGVDVVAAAKAPGVTALCGGINAVFAEGIRPVPTRPPPRDPPDRPLL